MTRRASAWRKHLTELFGPEQVWRDWEPETFRALLDVDEVGFNQVMALQVALNAQTYVDDETDETRFLLNNWRIFEKIVVATNGSEPDFTEVERAQPIEIGYALGQLEEMHPVEIDDEVAKYIAASFMTDNLVHCPFWPKVDAYIEPNEWRDPVKEAWAKRALLDLTKEHPVEATVARLLVIEAAYKSRE